MKNKIFSILMIVVVAFSSCLDDGTMNDLNQYKTILYFPSSGLTNVTLYKTGEKTVYNLNIYKAGYDTQAQPSVNVKLLSQPELDAYNLSNKTNYVLLPTFSYSIKSDLNFTFAPAELSKAIKIEFDTDTINTLDANVLKNSVLAFELSSATDSVNVNKKVIFVNPNIVVPVIAFQTPGDLVFNPTPGQEDPINFGSSLKLPVKSLWNFSVSIEADASAVVTYNTTNNTQFTMLPDSAFSLPTSITFSKGDIVKGLGLNVDLSKLKLGYYILPVKITSTDMTGLQIDGSYQYIIINYQPKKTTLTPIALAESMIVKHFFVTTWGNGLPGLFADGDAKTYAHSSTSLKPDKTYGIYFDILLANEVGSAYVSYSTRDWGGNAPKRIAVFTSIDGTVWNRALTISSGLPSAGSTPYETNVFSNESKYKYIRFCVLESQNGVMDDETKTTAGGYAITEFRLWAK